MSRHKRHIVHGAGVIHINMQQMDSSVLTSDDGIYTWLACRHCAQVHKYRNYRGVVSATYLLEGRGDSTRKCIGGLDIYMRAEIAH